MKEALALVCLLTFTSCGLSQTARLHSNTTHEDIRRAITILQNQILSEVRSNEGNDRLRSSALRNSLMTLEKGSRTKNDDTQRIISKLNSIDDRLTRLEEDLMKAESKRPSSDVDQTMLEKKMTDIEKSIELKLDEMSKRIHQASVTSSNLFPEFSKLNVRLKELEDFSIYTNSLTAETSLSLRRHELSLDKTSKRLLTEMSRITNESHTVTETVLANISKRLEEVQNSLMSDFKAELGEVGMLLPRIQDNVIRRAEYESTLTRNELAQLTQQQATTLSKTILNNLHTGQRELITLQEKHLKNLTSTIENEISQVWREIAIMRDNAKTSSENLNAIRNITSVYVEGSLKTVGKMNNDVMEIASSVGSFEQNLNLLLMRTKLFSTEFENIRDTLLKELGNLRNASKILQQQMEIRSGQPNPVVVDDSK